MADTATQTTEHLPMFITAPGETDVLFWVVAVLVVLILLIVGNLYLRLHAVPDRMAHGSNHAQLQLVGIMALIALLTHNNIFWIASLLLAAVNIPDLMTPINSIAQSLKRIADQPSGINQPSGGERGDDV